MKQDEFNFEDKDSLDDLEEDYSDDFDDFGGDLGVGSPSNMERHSDLLKNLTDFDPYLKLKVSEWLGMNWDQEKEKYVRDPNVEPIMNIKCARWCVNFLRVYVRGNNILTRLDKDIYRNMMEDIYNTVYLNIGTRAEEFDINKDGDIILICNDLSHSAILVLCGAGGKKTYVDFLGTVTNRNESVTLNQLPSNGMNQQQFNPDNRKRSGFLKSFKNMMS